jgi:putative ABC transport system permease protein
MPEDGGRDWKAVVRARLGPLALDPARAEDVVDEVAQHVAQHYAELVASGRADEEARAEALAPLRDPHRLAAEIARADRPRAAAPAPPPEPAAREGLLVDLARDVRYALRLLRRTPGFAAAAVLTLALGIGANTAIFSVVSAVLLRPLPYADPGRLVMVGERAPSGSASSVGFATFVDWRQRNHGFEDLALIRSWSPTLADGGAPERIPAVRVSSNYFRLLGVRPALGRDFLPEEDTADRWRVVLLSDGLWRRRFAADPAVVGRTITMNDRAFTIVGVLPASFEPLVSERLYQRADMWGLVGYDVSLPYACRGCQHLKAIGRLSRGVALEQARADIDAVQARLRAEHPTDYDRTGTMAVVPLEQELTGHLRPAVAVLMGAVAFVLLIACANVANLLLVRVAQRERELALRAALGASRARLVRQLLIECGLIGVAGGFAGLILAAWGVPLLVRLAPAASSRLATAHIDGRVLGFSLAVALATIALFGLLPALRGSRVELQSMLQAGARKTAEGPGSTLRRLLLAADVALAVVLLTGAGLMIRSVGRLLAVDPGFDPRGVLSLQVSFVGAAYAEDATVLARTGEILARLRALPGVEAAAAASEIPLGGNGDTWGFHIQGRVPANPADDPSAERYSVTPEYFAAMRIPLRQGRLLTDADHVSAEPVMLIGEQTARELWPHGDALGHHVRIGEAGKGPWRRIVGIVGDVRHHALASPPTLQMYLPQAQVTDSYLTLVIRGGGEPALLAAAARRLVGTVARDVPVYEVAPLSELVARSVAPRRFVMVLLEVFGAVALLMTAVGVYAVISYAVVERTREIGIREALGASVADVVRLVVGGGLLVVGAGLAAGTVVSLAATRWLEASLYGVAPTDPASLAAAAVTLLLIAAAAHGVPVMRALRIDPAVALRQE